ncbi:MAG: PAS domain S-box protein [Armatimonadota bacterium]|nr:PAS domain S-box protein [Armatimonadota bacterium]
MTESGRRIPGGGRGLAGAIVATIREPLLVLDPELCVLTANRAFYRVFQTTPAETEGRRLYELGNRQWDIPALRRLLEEILPLNTSFDDFEVVHDFPHIGRRTMLLNARRMFRRGQKAPMILLAIEDVTDRRRIEQQLREREEWFRRLADITSTAIVIYQGERVVYANRAAQVLTGYSFDELLGQRFWDVVHPEFQDLVRDRGLARQRGENVPERYEFKIVCKDGEERWVDFTAGLIDWEGQPAGLATGFDITDRRRAQERQERRLAELEALLRVSFALRTADTTDAALPILLDETLAILETDSGAVSLYDRAAGHLRSAVTRGWFAGLHDAPLRPGEGIAGTVFATGAPHRSPEFARDPLSATVTGVPPGWGGACVPIRVEAEVVGVLFVAVPRPREVTTEEMALLLALAEMAGAALRRMRLHEETLRRLAHLQALRTVDRAISGSLDLRLTLDILLDQAVIQLRLDAAGVLLAQPRLNLLEPAASRGFRTRAYAGGRLRFGEGVAGRAALEKQRVIVTHPTQAPAYTKTALLDVEGFQTHFAVPLVAKAEIKGVLEGFHRAPFTPDAEWLDLLDALAGQGAIAIDNAQLFERAQRSSLELTVAYDATIEGWARALDLRHRETHDHTRRVTDMALQLARALGVREEDLPHMRRGALLHDIGKMGVPDAILMKPGPLNDDEWAVMRQHPQMAYDLLSPIEFLRPALDIPYCHHEKWDGTGYPRGLKGEDIPLAARIFAVVDTFDALTSERPYRPAWSRPRALAHIAEQAGTELDPRVVEAFLRMMQDST